MMHPAGESPPQKAMAASQARVVFYCEDEREARFGQGDHAFFIVDEKAHLLGALLWGTSFVVDLPAGEHQFFAWDEWVVKLSGPSVDSAMKAHLEPGATYFVRLTSLPRPWYQRAVNMHFSVATGEALSTPVRPYVVDREEALAWAQSHEDEIRKHVADGEILLSRGTFTVLGKEPERRTME